MPAGNVRAASRQRIECSSRVLKAAPPRSLCRRDTDVRQLSVSRTWSAADETIGRPTTNGRNRDVIASVRGLSAAYFVGSARLSCLRASNKRPQLFDAHGTGRGRRSRLDYLSCMAAVAPDRRVASRRPAREQVSARRGIERPSNRRRDSGADHHAHVCVLRPCLHLHGHRGSLPHSGSLPSDLGRSAPRRNSANYNCCL